MRPAMVNIALPLVEKEIAAILATYPYYPYQQEFAEPKLQLNLLAYVLNRVLGIYVVVEQEALDSIPYRASSKRMLDIETAIHDGIKYLISVNNTNNYLPHCFSLHQSDNDSKLM